MRRRGTWFVGVGSTDFAQHIIYVCARPHTLCVHITSRLSSRRLILFRYPNCAIEALAPSRAAGGASELHHLARTSPISDRALADNEQNCAKT